MSVALDSKLTEQAVNTIKFLAVDAVEQANSGHPGMPMGMADTAHLLWTEFLRLDPSDPNWLGRDRRGTIQEGERDFVLLDPESGLLFVEVKGGTLAVDRREWVREVRGQRTHTNARSRRGPRRAIAGKRHKTGKKG